MRLSNSSMKIYAICASFFIQGGIHAFGTWNFGESTQKLEANTEHEQGRKPDFNEVVGDGEV
ncbi:hypothetical protein BO99DRAFT_98205 [Aspergillus violaceofuscus CBS 115571]|uniref:Uncharacterized protein n=1 Tax=Aspergillus violaceofuscus (strain CBS 115571) TaxID=1450538 RepID=A0A2V5HXV6_ASPV1|nr:hypothetical protein BO99DRAFT_98205 [Aspergillus violaceofuscus CBS 115571]